MTDRLFDIGAVGFVVRVGQLVQDLRLELPDDLGTMYVSRVEFVHENGGRFEPCEPFLRRQGHGLEYELAMAVSDE